VGVLNVQTDETRDTAATNFSVLRIKRNVLRRSNVGMIFTNRKPSAPGGGSNRVYGTDANMLFYENLRLNGYYARSDTPGLDGDTESYRGQLLYLADRYGFQLDRLKIGGAFNPEIGFLRRNDFNRTFAQARFSPRPASNRHIRKLTWEASLDRYVNSAEVLETQQDTATFRVEFHNSDVLTLNYYRNYEFLSEPFDVSGGVIVPAGRYRFHEAVVNYQIGPQRPLSGTVNLSHGGFYTGYRTQTSFSGRAKFSPQLALEPRVSIDWVDLPQERFRVTLIGARPTFTITPRMFVSALVQYNSRTNSLETNIRWRWEYQPGSDLFVVYTDGRNTGGPGFSQLLNRSFAVKLTRFLRF
jgi:hypothetical protein